MEDFAFYQLVLELASHCWKVKIPFEIDFKINGDHNRFAIYPNNPPSFTDSRQVTFYQSWDNKIVQDQIELIKERIVEESKRQNTYQGEKNV